MTHYDTDMAPIGPVIPARCNRPVPSHEPDDRRVASRRSLLVLAIIFVAAALATGGNLRRPLEIDETVSFWIADRSSLGSLLDRSLRYSATPPLSFACQRVLLDTLGPHELVLRIPAWAGFLGSVIGIWYLAGRWLHPLAGALAALLLAVHPMAQKFAVQGRPYSVGMLLTIGAVGTTWSIGRLGFRWDRFLAWFALNVALVYTHYLFALVWLLELAWLAAAARRGTVRLVSVMIWFTGLGLAAVPLGVPILHVWEHREFLNWTPYPPPWAELVAPLLPFRWPRARQPVLWLILAAGFAWQVARHGYRLQNWFDTERSKAFVRVLPHAAAWTVVPVGVLSVLGSFWLPSLATDRYLLIYIPGGVVLFAGLLSSLRGRILPGLLLSVLVWLQADFGWISAAYESTLRSRLKDGSNQSNGEAAAGRAAPARGTSVDQRWKEAATSLSGLGPHDRILVGTGLTEMKLVPVYFGDAIFQDYVTCRLSRFYFKGACVRLSLPMRWTPELASAYRRRLPVESSSVAAPEGSVSRRAGTDAPPGIWLVAATDTDLLLAAAEQARELIQSWGWVETSSDHHDAVLVAHYLPPWSLHFDGTNDIAISAPSVTSDIAQPAMNETGQ